MLSHFLVGAYDDEGPPVPIPNTVVKLIRAENTWREAARKDRSAPTPREYGRPIGWSVSFCFVFFFSHSFLSSSLFGINFAAARKSSVRPRLAIADIK